MPNSSDDFVAVIAILCIFGLPLAYAIASRYFAHQERLAMIQKGVTPPPDPSWAKRAAKSGWYDPSAYPQTPSGYNPYAYSEYQAGCQLRKGITCAMIGFALLVGLSFINPGRPGPWLLGGLIPMFVGIAQIIIAVLGGARFGPFGSIPPQGPGPSRQQAQPYQQPPFVGGQEVPQPPYGWRPGSTPELEKPPAPPEPR